MRKFQALIVLICLGFWSAAQAGTALDPSRDILAARTLGMGGAHLGLSSDGEGMFINPSGLANISYPQMIAVSTKIMLEETAYSLVGGSWPTAWGTFGLGFVGTSISGSYSTVRDPASGRININASGEVISHDSNVLLLSYSRPLPWDRSSIGGNLKFYNQSLSTDRGLAMNLDLSATAQPAGWLTLAATLQNSLGGNLSWKNSSDKLGGYFKLGGALTLLDPQEGLFHHSQKLVAALDLDLPQNILANSNSMLMHLGLEWTPISWLNLRAGLNQANNGTSLAFGLGLTQSAFRFDYAYAPRPELAADNASYFSLSYVGALETHVKTKLNHKEPALAITYPPDRYITSEADLNLAVEARAKRVIDQQTIWEVPAFSSTSEVKEIFEYENLDYLALNNTSIESRGVFEQAVALRPGRNILKLVGYIMPDVRPATAEVRVLKFAPFVDVPMDFWAIRPLAICSTLKLIEGYPDGSFKPHKGITRAELVTLLVRTMGISPETWAEAKFYSEFKDVKTRNWALPYINIAVSKGLVTGYPDRTFKPNKVLSRAEGVAILTRYADLETKEDDLSVFKDLEKEFWAHKHIMAAHRAGWLDYLTTEFFTPHDPFPRVEAAYIFYKTPQIEKQVEAFWDHGETGGEAKPAWME